MYFDASTLPRRVSAADQSCDSIPKGTRRDCIIPLLLIAVLKNRKIIFKHPNNNKILRILSLILDTPRKLMHILRASIYLIVML